MDVLELIDKLADLVRNAKQVPLEREVRVDKEKLADLLDQMRATIPEEIKEARWIVKERAGDARRGRARGRTDPRRGAASARPSSSASITSRARPSSQPRTSSTTPAPRSARFAWAPRTTPTRSSAPSSSTSPSSSPPSSAAANASSGPTNQPQTSNTEAIAGGPGPRLPAAACRSSEQSSAALAKATGAIRGPWDRSVAFSVGPTDRALRGLWTRSGRFVVLPVMQHPGSWIVGAAADSRSAIGPEVGTSWGSPARRLRPNRNTTISSPAAALAHRLAHAPHDGLGRVLRRLQCLEVGPALRAGRSTRP